KPHAPSRGPSTTRPPPSSKPAQGDRRDRDPHHPDRSEVEAEPEPQRGRHHRRPARPPARRRQGTRHRRRDAPAPHMTGIRNNPVRLGSTATTALAGAGGAPLRLTQHNRTVLPGPIAAKAMMSSEPGGVARGQRGVRRQNSLPSGSTRTLQ